jgi:serine protease Do
MMKKLTVTSLILIVAMILGACGSTTALVKTQVANLVGPAEQSSAPAAQTNGQLQPVSQNQAPAPTATPGAPPVELPAGTASQLAAYEGALSQIYETVNPSVVNIHVLVGGTQTNQGDQNLPQIPGLPFGFGPNQNQGPNSMPQGEALGSGFVWDKQGHIVTNNHVVDGSTQIDVTFSDGTTVPATVVGRDPDSDLAVIKVDISADKLQPVTLGDSNQVKVGQIAVAIGNPFGLEGSMTTGIISAIGRVVPANETAAVSGAPSYSIPDIIQTDAPINPGNSGGVLVNDEGQLIGVTFMIESSTQSNAGIGFAIPSKIVSKVVPSLIQNGAYEHPYIGISGRSLIPALAEAMNLDSTQRGALVGDITPGSPADKAGLKGSAKAATINGQSVNVGGDVITAIDGTQVQGMDDLISYLANSTSVGDKVTLTILRNGKQMTLDLTLAARPSEQPSAQVPSGNQQPRQARAYMGITAGTMVPQIAEAMGLPNDQTGVLVEQVQTGGPADNAGMQGSYKSVSINGQPVMIGGDVIIAIDGNDVTSMEDLSSMLQNYNTGDRITVTVLRDGSKMDLQVTLGERPSGQ